jgi:mono/diheme cytochrome c family protein
MPVRRILAIAALLAVAGVVAAAAFVAAGVYDVAATTSHTQVVHSLLQLTMRQSVRRQAHSVQVPASAPADAAARGALCFRAHCVACHGAPGVAPQPAALGLQPPAPSLTGAAREWSTRELYWLTRHGIKMTGMPAWQYRLADEDLWAVVGWIERLPALTPAEWAAIDKSLGERGCDDRRDALPLREPDPERGRAAMPRHGCTGCHVIEGVVGSQVHVGPALAAGFARRLMLPGGVANTAENRERWLREPRSIDAHSAMPALGLSAQDARDMAAYLGTLR